MMTDKVNSSKMLVSVTITAQNICIYSYHIQGVQLYSYNSVLLQSNTDGACNTPMLAPEPT